MFCCWLHYVNQARFDKLVQGSCELVLRYAALLGVSVSKTKPGAVLLRQLEHKHEDLASSVGPQRSKRPTL
jgi:hypothetical protein